MPDVLGYRAKMAVLVPSTNTVVEPELYDIGPHGVTFHVGRMYIPSGTMRDDAEFEKVMTDIRASMDIALRDVLTVEPDYVLMGMSSITFWDGVEAHRQLKEHIEQASGLGVTTGAGATAEALRVYGARRVAVLSPYQAIADAHVTRFLTESGFDVVAFKGLRCPTAVSIAQVDEPTLRTALVELNRSECDAIVQVGTNLAMIRQADAAERWLGKPVIAINAAILWHGLRSFGIRDQLRGFGSLLREH